MGIGGNLLSWIKSWLLNRRQRVRVKDSFIDWERIESGIPQGLVLGPLFFFLYICDLNLETLDDPKILSMVLKYVDYAKIISRISKLEDMEEMQRILNHIYRWQSLNNIEWNRGKFVKLYSGPKDVSENSFLSHLPILIQLSGWNQQGILGSRWIQGVPVRYRGRW